jgi:hypothetical protein
MGNLIWYQHKTKPEIKIILGDLDNAGWSYGCTVLVKGDMPYYSSVTVEELKDFKRIKVDEKQN